MPTLRAISLPAIIWATGVLFAQGAAAEVDADDAIHLARNNGCFRCHAMQSELKEGPAWVNIAARRRDNPAAQAELTEYITSSGKRAMFLTGEVIYHKTVQTSPPDDKAQIKNLVDWILAL